MNILKNNLNIKEEILDNGSVLYQVKDNSIPIIYFKLIIENGSLTEDKNELGITALLSQMLTRGNKNFSQDKIDYELDKLSASLNIASNYDFFAIISRLPADNFEKYLDFLDKLLFSDMNFDEEQFEISKSKAKSLLSMIKENDSYLSSVLFSNILFKNENYGLISSGNSDSLDKLKIQNLEKRLNILKNSSHFWLIGGDFNNKDIEKIKKFADKFKIDLKNKIKTIETHKPKGWELYYHNKPDKNKTSVIVGANSISLNHEKLYSMLFFNKYFGSDFTSILSQEIREKNGWSYYAASEFILYKYATSFLLRYAPDINNLTASISYLNELFKNTLNSKADKNLVEFTRKKILNSYFFKFSTTIKKLSLLSDLKLYNYPDNFFENYLNEVKNMTPEKLKNDIDKIITPDNQIVVMVGDIDKKIKELEGLNFTKITQIKDLDFLN